MPVMRSKYEYHPFQCNLCGAAITSPAALRDHLVEKHGFICENGQVFERRLCSCGKPGLYAIGQHVACADHRDKLQLELKKRSGHLDVRP